MAGARGPISPGMVPGFDEGPEMGVSGAGSPSHIVQCVFGGGSLLFALSTAYVTWSWARDREGLTRPLVDAIESFQQLLK